MHQLEKDAVFQTTMASLVITRDLLQRTGTQMSSYMKMFYEISDSYSDNVTLHFNHFHKLGKKKHLKIEVYGRSGKKYCTIHGKHAMDVEECVGPSHDLVMTTIHVWEGRNVYKDFTVFKDQIKGLNSSLVNIHFAWRGII